MLDLAQVLPQGHSQGHSKGQPKLKGFIFDLGQVIIRWDSRYIWQQVIPDEVEMQRHMKFFRPFISLSDAGVSGPMMVEVLSSIMPDKAPLFRFWWEHWTDAFRGENEDTVAIVRELKTLGYPLYVLSNFSLQTLERVRHQIPSLDLFDDVIISAAENMVKPQVQIFELAIQRFGLRQQGREGSGDPSHYLFIDDLADNIAAAQSCGLLGHLFTEPELLRRELEQRGIFSERK